MVLFNLGFEVVFDELEFNVQIFYGRFKLLVILLQLFLYEPVKPQLVRLVFLGELQIFDSVSVISFCVLAVGNDEGVLVIIQIQQIQIWSLLLAEVGE